MNVFAVFRTGYYRHGCGGVFSTKEAAIEAAEAMAEVDCDDYHQYDVVPFALDQRSVIHCEVDELGEQMSPPILEAQPIYSCRGAGADQPVQAAAGR
jgi:hypothetical protein